MPVKCNVGSNIPRLASDGTQVYAIHVKQGGYISKQERLELIEWAKAFNAKPVVAVKRKRWMLNQLP